MIFQYLISDIGLNGVFLVGLCYLKNIKYKNKLE